jgi:hypothetical protein
MLDAYQKALDDLTLDYQTDGGRGFGDAVVTPYPIFPSCGGYVPHRGGEYWGPR